MMKVENVFILYIGYLKIATSPYRRRDKKPSELMRNYEMRLRRQRKEARKKENEEMDRLRRSTLDDVVDQK
jgi:hypothetical protein